MAYFREVTTMKTLVTLHNFEIMFASYWSIDGAMSMCDSSSKTWRCMALERIPRMPEPS